MIWIWESNTAGISRSPSNNMWRSNIATVNFTIKGSSLYHGNSETKIMYKIFNPLSACTAVNHSPAAETHSYLQYTGFKQGCKITRKSRAILITLNKMWKLHHEKIIDNGECIFYNMSWKKQCFEPVFKQNECLNECEHPHQRYWGIKGGTQRKQQQQ